MIDRGGEKFDVTPSRRVGEAGCGSTVMVAWLADEREVEPHEKLMDKSERTDKVFSQETSSSTPKPTSMNAPGRELRRLHRAPRRRL